MCMCVCLRVYPYMCVLPCVKRNKVKRKHTIKSKRFEDLNIPEGGVLTLRGEIQKEKKTLY